MRVEQIISESRDGNRMEIIGRDSDSQRTLHIQQKNKEWRYFVGHDREGKEIFLPIRMEVKK